MSVCRVGLSTRDFHTLYASVHGPYIHCAAQVFKCQILVLGPNKAQPDSQDTLSLYNPYMFLHRT